MISNELLSEVLGHSDICNERIMQNKLLYICENDGMIDYEYEYNIYELAHKCKEWALSKGYNIWSDCLGSVQIQDEDFETIYSVVTTVKEVKGIIKACEWILNNKPL